MKRLLGSVIICSFASSTIVGLQIPRTERPNVFKDEVLKGRHVAARPFLYWLAVASNAFLFWQVLTNASLAGQVYAMAQTSPPCSQPGILKAYNCPWMGLPLRPIMRSSGPILLPERALMHFCYAVGAIPLKHLNAPGSPAPRSREPQPCFQYLGRS